MVKKSLQLELCNFMQELNLKELKYVTNSAYNQARMKIKPEIFKHFVTELNESFYTNNDERVTLWNGFRLLACDGSFLNLPFVPAIVEKFGALTNQHDTEVLNGRCTILYDVENNIILNGGLASYKIGEREMLLTILKDTRKHNFNDLIILDRGYPSFDLVYEFKKRKSDVLIRLKPKYSLAIEKFYESNEQDVVIELQPGRGMSFFKKLYNKKTTILIRLIKVVLESGEIELLMTTLLDAEKFPLSIFKELYFKRWGIETLFDKLKNKLKIELFTGYSEISIMQDFYCTLFISNIQSLLVSEANDELKSQNITNKKYLYKVNTNLSIGFLKTRIIELFSKNNKTENTLLELEKLFLKTLVPIRPGRSFERDTYKYRARKKPAVTKNFKNAL